MTNHIMNSLVVGVRRRWRTGLTHAFGVAGALWLLTEIATRVSSSADSWLDANGDTYLCVVLVAAVGWFIGYTYEHRTVSFQVPTTDSTITIKFGNLFEETTADWLIGVNEFFDGRLGQVIARSSVHGQFITNVFNGDESSFRHAVTHALAGLAFKPTSRADLPADAYAIGTTAVVPNGARKAFLVAMTETDLTTHKARATVPMLWDAMKGALGAVKNYGNGEPIAMPLIGNGLSSVNVEPQHLLRLIALALVDFGRKEGLPKQVTIVVPQGCFEQLDIREIRRDWKKA